MSFGKASSVPEVIKVNLILVGTEDARGGVVTQLRRATGSPSGALSISHEGKNYEVSIEEYTPSQGNVSALSKGDGFVAVYSAFDWTTFDPIRDYLDFIASAKRSPTFPCVLVATDPSEAVTGVSRAHGTALAQRRKCGFVEVSDPKDLRLAFGMVCGLTTSSRTASPGLDSSSASSGSPTVFRGVGPLSDKTPSPTNKFYNFEDETPLSTALPPLRTESPVPVRPAVSDPPARKPVLGVVKGDDRLPQRFYNFEDETPLSTSIVRPDVPFGGTVRIPNPEDSSKVGSKKPFYNFEDDSPSSDSLPKLSSPTVTAAQKPLTSSNANLRASSSAGSTIKRNPEPQSQSKSPSKARFNVAETIVNEDQVPLLQKSPGSRAKGKSPSKARFNAADDIAIEEYMPIRPLDVRPAVTKSPSRARFNASDEIVNEDEGLPRKSTDTGAPRSPPRDKKSPDPRGKPRSPTRPAFNASDKVVNEDDVPLRKSPAPAKPQSPSKARFNASNERVNEEAVSVRATAAKSPSKARFNASDKVINEEALPSLRRSPDPHSIPKPQSPTRTRFNASNVVVNEEALPPRRSPDPHSAVEASTSPARSHFNASNEVVNEDAVPKRNPDVPRVGAAPQSASRARFHASNEVVNEEEIPPKSATGKSPAENRFNSSADVVDDESTSRRARTPEPSSGSMIGGDTRKTGSQIKREKAALPVSVVAPQTKATSSPPSSSKGILFSSTRRRPSDSPTSSLREESINPEAMDKQGSLGKLETPARRDALKALDSSTPTGSQRRARPPSPPPSLRKIFDTISTASEAPGERVQFTVALLCTDVLGEPSSWNQAKQSLLNSIGSQLGSADGRCVINFKLIPQDTSSASRWLREVLDADITLILARGARGVESELTTLIATIPPPNRRTVMVIGFLCPIDSLVSLLPEEEARQRKTLQAVESYSRHSSLPYCELTGYSNRGHFSLLSSLVWILLSGSRSNLGEEPAVLAMSVIDEAFTLDSSSQLSKAMMMSTCKKLFFMCKRFTDASVRMLCKLITANPSLEMAAVQCDIVRQESALDLVTALLGNSTCKQFIIPANAFVPHPEWAAVYPRLSEECRRLLVPPPVKPCIKILLLGHGGSGKTSLVKCLQQLVGAANTGASLTEPSTIGVETHTLSESGVDLSVWDFAGQLEYHSTHKHFFSAANAIYVVVVDISKPLETQRAQLGRWLTLLTSKIGTSKRVAVVVLGTKIDLIQNFDPEIASGPLRSVMQEFDLPFVKKRILFASMITQSGIKNVRSQIMECAKDLSKEGKLNAATMAVAVMQMGALVVRAQKGDVRSVIQPERAMMQLMTPDMLTALHDRGLILWEREAELVCVWPSLLSRLIALFNGPEDHRARLTATRLPRRSALVPERDAESILRQLPELRSRPSQELLGLLRSLEALGVCYFLTEGVHAKSGFLFPGLRPACEIFHLPYLPLEDHIQTASAPIRCRVVQFTVPTTRYGDAAGDMLTKIQVRLRSLHDHRYQLFSNCVILRDRLSGDQALISLWDNLSPPVIRLFCRGRTFDKLLDTIYTLAADLRSLPMEELCGVCIQSSRFSKIDDKNVCTLGHTSHGEFGEVFELREASKQSLWNPREGPLFYSCGEWKSRGALRYTELTEKDTDSTRKAEYVRVRQMFYKFVGKDTAQNFTLDRVVFLHQPAFEQAFASFYEELMAANLGSESFDRWDASDTAEETAWREWVMQHLDNYVERVSGNDRLNLIAGWHGTTEESCWNIAEKNFYDPAEREARRNPNKPIDPGYFGKGIYFTQYPSYGAKYARESSCMLVSWVMMGRPYPAIESPMIDNPRTLLGKGCRVGFNSHYAVVKQKGPTYFPCPQWNTKGEEETPDFDEVVVFQKRQVLPRYIIYYQRTQDQPRSQSFVNPRFEQIDESSHTHAPLTILWVDNPNPESELMRKLLRNGMPATVREVISFVSSDELKVWLRMHWSCAVRKQIKIRIITNRTRERDGGVTAGESLIAWLRTTKEVPEWKKIKCLLFCGDTSKVKHVVAPDLTYVSSNSHVLANFCEPKPDWSKIV